MNKKLYINAEKEFEFACGLNEHQAAALYVDTDAFGLTKVNGEKPTIHELYNADIGLNLAAEVCSGCSIVMFMGNPIFVAEYKKFRPQIDLKNCTIVINGEITNGLIHHFIDTNNCPDFLIGTKCERYALELIQKHIPHLKVFTSSLGFQPHENIYNTRWGFLYQEADNLKEEVITEDNDIDMKIAYAIIKYSRSFCYTLVENGLSLIIKHGLRCIDAHIKYPNAVFATDYPFRNLNEVKNITAGKIIFPGTYLEDEVIHGNMYLLKYNHIRI